MPRGVFKHKPHTEEWKANISAKLKGQKKPARSAEHRLRISLSKIGLKQSPETKKKRSLALIGNTWNIGKKRSAEDRIKRSIASKGDRNPNWKGGKDSEAKRLRKTFAFAEWREAVYKRDNYTCQFCGEKKKYLNAHHIRLFALFPALRFDVANGVTLCEECHKETPTYLNSHFKKPTINISQ